MNPKNDNFLTGAVLPFVERPSRYIDSELNLPGVGYREGALNVLLVFPDAYEIGMSHLGLRFLYDRLARMEGIGVELAFAPWPDAEDLMRETGEPLRSWQTGTPAGEFDLIGVSVTYELHYTNILMILDLAGLALESSSRGETDPLVVAGGPACANPLPFIEAVDAVFLGDGEESLSEAVVSLARLKAAGASRKRRREALAEIEGVYVDGVSSSARSRVYHFQPGDLPRRPIVASSELVHQRLAVEIMRGCARGCRFCHAGFFYRPCRERSVEEIVAAALEGLDATGWDELSLLSLSTSDYSRLDELLERLVPELARRQVSLALPSLRPETVTRRIVAASSIVSRSGFTLAPEAGTERLRRVINKGMTDEEILSGCLRILEGGWQTLKLYFMVGLPTETPEDLDGISSLVQRILALPRRRGRFNLSVSISPFVPKPHTPFQWERQASIEEYRAAEDLLGDGLRARHVKLALRNPAVSVLEGILARGDRGLWPVLRRAYELGRRFDGWVDQFNFDVWEEAIVGCGFSVSKLLAARSTEEALPWDIFEPRVSRDFLLGEREKARAGTLTPWRRGDREQLPAAAPEEPFARRSPRAPHPPEAVFRYRCVFEKSGRERYLSHIETLGVIQRALRRSGLPLSFSEGFSPRPRIAAGPALAVGMEGMREFFDLELTRPSRVSPELFAPLFPAGLRIVDCAGPFTRRQGRLPAEGLFRYRLGFDAVKNLVGPLESRSELLSREAHMWYLLAETLGVPGLEGFDPADLLPDPAASFDSALREIIEGGAVIADGKGRERSSAGCSSRLAEGDVEIVLPVDDRGIVRPQDVIRAILPEQLAALVRIRRLEMLFRSEKGFIEPIEFVRPPA